MWEWHPLKKAMATHSSTLAWKIPWMDMWEPNLEHGTEGTMMDQRTGLPAGGGVGDPWLGSHLHHLRTTLAGSSEL